MIRAACKKLFVRTQKIVAVVVVFGSGFSTLSVIA